MSLFVDTLLPLPLANLYTYAVPPTLEEQVAIGCRVIVSFGQKKYYTAIVVAIHDRKPEGYNVKEITDVLDAAPILLPLQYQLWQWIAQYYLCTEGEVYKAAVPSGMKLENETWIEINTAFEGECSLTDREQLVLDALQREKRQTIVQLEKLSGVKRILPTIKSLLDKECILVIDKIRESYRPKTEVWVRLTDKCNNEEALNKVIAQLGRARQQAELIMAYAALTHCFEEGAEAGVNRKRLINHAQSSLAALHALVKKGVFEIYDHVIGRLGENEEPSEMELNPLNEAQRNALAQIKATFATKEVCLLHGVTSSGKTEIYIHLISEALREGKQVLYLLPEIALTTQITDRLKRVFGNRLGVYHSKFPDAERVEIWQKQLTDTPYDIILGVRSSIFLPFKRLGLVIVDEEHENSFKQQDPAPRYHARSASIMLAHKCGAKTLLGTATPSIESFYNAQQGKYGLVTLSQRYKDLQLPHVIVVDVKDLRRRKIMKGPLSPPLVEAIREALSNNEQVILFQNRRGFAPMVECHTCGWVPKCQNCDVSLTYHKSVQLLTCHYCGATIGMPHSCKACEGEDLVSRGYGTEKIEDVIHEIFPDAKVARMDLDTTRTRNAHSKIIHDFETGQTDILIGTQMVSKGLDFDRVSVVGILDADAMMNIPDFRAHERAYQLMAQVAGRAGRKFKQGRVYLQTKSADLPLIQHTITNNYQGLYDSQLDERRFFHYPPLVRLIYVNLKSRHESVVNEAAMLMAEHLRAHMGDRILGPDKPAVSRIQQLFIKKIMVKVEMAISMKAVHQLLLHEQALLTSDERFRTLQIHFDVDPQ